MFGITLNPTELDAVIRNTDGLTDCDGFKSVELSRRDSFNNPYNDGFLIVTMRFSATDTYPEAIEEYAISETGSTTFWTHRQTSE